MTVLLKRECRITNYFQTGFDIIKHKDLVNASLGAKNHWIGHIMHQHLLIYLAEKHLAELKQLVKENDIVYLSDIYLDDPEMAEKYERIRRLNVFCSRAH